MKVAIVFAALVAVACAGVISNEHVETLKYDNVNAGDNTYTYGFEQSDGTVVAESGHLNNVGTDHEAIAVTGSFKYVGTDGQTYTVNYVADENGFQPEGSHLPHA